MSGEPSLPERKRVLRAALRAQPPPSAEEAQAVRARVAALPEVVGATCVGLFASLPDEPGTRPLFETLRARGARCLLPRATEALDLEFVAADRWEDLRPGRYGVLEPPIDGDVVDLGEASVLLVPGVAFDPAGGRLGRGGGSYDRVLARVEHTFVVGLTVERRMVAEVPREPHDRRVDAVVTESRVLSRGR